MLDALRFVKGAVGSKTLVASLTHFCIRHGRITGYNGKLALSAPIALDVDALPKADPFVKAIGLCEQEVSLTLTPANRIVVRSGAFRATIECTTEEYPHPTIDAPVLPLSCDVLNAMRALLPYIGEDAARPWSRGMLLRGQSAYATNNIILAQHWLGQDFPASINIPIYTVQEMLRIGEEPVAMQVTETAIMFHYTGERWIYSNLYATEWPNVHTLLEREHAATPVPDGFFEGLAKLAPFAPQDGRVVLTQHGMHTGDPLQDGAGVDIALPELSEREVSFNLPQLSKLQGNIASIDFTAHPSPCLFFGPGLRGCIIGMR